MRMGVLIVAAGLLVAADTKEDAVRKERKKLQGDWVLVAGEVDGKKIPDEHIKKSSITHEGEKCVLHTPHQAKGKIRAALTLDPTRTPHEMDWVRSEGPNAGKTMKAIYEWDGPDRYRICFDPSGKSRPREFTTKPGTGYILHVWKRATK